jgi:hypothetical protein
MNEAFVKTMMPFLLFYFGIGCMIGLLEYGIARHAFRDHPERHAMSQHDLLLTCLFKNAIAWPVILFWVALLAVAKVFIYFRRG